MLWRFSRSHVECDNFCRYKAYLQYYWGGTGVVPTLLNMDLELGSYVHAGLARLLRARTVAGIDVAVAEARDEYSAKMGQIDYGPYVPQEQVDLGEALIRGWAIARLPFYVENFEISPGDVESERNVSLGDDIELMVRIDARATSRESGDRFAGPEFKTTSYLTQDYLDSWRYDSQISAHLSGEESGVLLEFLYKGTRRNGKVLSALIKDKPPGASVREWLEKLPRDIVMQQFSGMEVYRPAGQVQRWLEAAKARQYDIKNVLVDFETGKFQQPLENELNLVFPPRLDSQCKRNKYGKECEYFRHCWGATSIERGLEYGIWTRRTPHHPIEKENFVV